ncbi:deoxynucleoside kinase [Dethiothermospora halolimnae]|uniref:deoxynucleoside kinase n=1 Tax=Dethiothermospora halolimnae TaxID=3114390 RepID=UPI003CCC309D
MKQVILIDGVVGAGKTTLGRILEKELNTELYEELTDQDTHRLLDKFYANKKRWAFTLQVHFLNKRFHMIKEIHRNNGGILDRSIFGDRIFASMLNEDGEMSDEEYRTYSTLLDNMLEHSKNPTILIYLKCSVDKAVERIKLRNRGLEATVPIRYWERLNEKYENWYQEYDYSPKVTIDMDRIDLKNKNDRREVIDKIKKEILLIEDHKVVAKL